MTQKIADDRANLKIPSRLHKEIKVAAAERGEEMYALVEKAWASYKATTGNPLVNRSNSTDSGSPPRYNDGKKANPGFSTGEASDSMAAVLQHLSDIHEVSKETLSTVKALRGSLDGEKSRKHQQTIRQGRALLARTDKTLGAPTKGPGKRGPSGEKGAA